MERADGVLRREPGWCVVDHADDPGPPEHQSEGVAVAAVAVADRGRRSEPTGRELVAVLHGDGELLGLYVGDGEDQYLDLTIESWRRLIPVIEATLDRARYS